MEQEERSGSESVPSRVDRDLGHDKSRIHIQPAFCKLESLVLLMAIVIMITVMKSHKAKLLTALSVVPEYINVKYM